MHKNAVELEERTILRENSNTALIIQQITAAMNEKHNEYKPGEKANCRMLQRERF